MGTFRFKQFEVCNERSALKVGTDGVLLGAAMTVTGNESHLLDIGTGTGVIALMAAQRLSASGNTGFRIEGIDIDGPSAEEAAGNFASSPWAPHLAAARLRLQEFKPDARYDLIFSNPPFYDNSLTNPDARETAARHTGSLSYREICAFAASWLNPGGRLALILPADHERDLARVAASFGLHLSRILRIRTTPAKPVKRIIAEFGTGACTAPVEESLTIHEGTRLSAGYMALTSGFYLDR